MWQTYRNKKILSGRELLRITRPDISTLKYVKGIVWSISAVVLIAAVIFNWNQMTSYVGFFSFLIILLPCFIFIILHLGINTNPIIFTEEGITQSWKSVLWKDIEGYQWIPISQNFSILRVFPSNSMPISMQLNNIRGGFGTIHSDSKKSIEDLLLSKGIKYQECLTKIREENV